MKTKILNLQNILSLLRLALVPVFLIMALNNLLSIALITFVMSIFIEILSRLIVKKEKETILSKILDTFADRVMRITVLSYFLSVEILPLWTFLILVICDSLMFLGYLVLTIKEVIINNENFITFESVFIFVGIILMFLDKLINPWSLLSVMAGAFMAIFAIVYYTLIYFNRLRWFILKR